MSPTSSHLEKRFLTLWQTLAPDLPLETQKTKVVPGRKYVYDFCCPDANVLFEINGGTWARGNSGHSSGKGIARDYDKINKANLEGYTVFVFAAEHITKEYIRDVTEYCRAIVTAE